MRLNRQGMIQAGSGMIPSGNGMVPSGWGMVQGGNGMIPGNGVVGATTPAYVLPGAAAFINMFKNGLNNFGASSWTQVAVQDTTYATKTTAPDGTNTASKLIATSANTFHYFKNVDIVRSSSLATYGVIVDVKAAEYTRIAILMEDSTGNNIANVGFDVAGGQVAYTAVAGTGVTISGTPQIFPIGSGFFRCICDFLIAANHPSIHALFLVDSGSGTGAQSQSFAGNGTNGIYIWQVNLLPTSARTLGTQLLNDDFTSLSTIDVNNTKASGFNFYFGNPWNVPGGGSSAFNTITPPQTADFSVSGSLLTVARDRSGFGFTLCSAVYDGAGSFKGRAFAPPFLVEFSDAFSTAPAAVGNAAPYGDMFPIEWLQGTVTTGNITEIGIIENDGTGPGTVTDNEGFNNFLAAGGGENSAQLTISSGVSNYAVQNRWSRLWLTQAATGGRGLTQSYVNGVFIPGTEVTYATGTGSIPAAVSSNFSSIFVDVETMHHTLILGGGFAFNESNLVWGGDFDFARVYGASSSQVISH